MLRRWGVLFCVFQLLSSCPANAKGPFGSIQVGQWSGGAYTTDSTGAFSHCSAGTTYVSGIHLMVGLNADRQWTLGFMHQSWTLNPGETIPISLTFDGREQFNVFGIAVTPSIVFVTMPQTSIFLTQFRRSTLMTAFAKGNAFQFNLNSTSELMPALARCVEQVNRGGIKSAGNFSALPKTAAPPPPPAQAPVSTVAGSLPPAPSPDYQIEAIQFATNFILKSGLQNPRLLGRIESPVMLASNGAAWQSDEAYGSVQIIAPDGSTTGIDVASAIAAADAKSCKGKFASGRVSELVDSDVVFRGFAICEDTDGMRSAQYFVVPRRSGGFVVFGLASDMKTELSRNVVKDERLSGFRKAALLAAAFHQ